MELERFENEKQPTEKRFENFEDTLENNFSDEKYEPLFGLDTLANGSEKSLRAWVLSPQSTLEDLEQMRAMLVQMKEKIENEYGLLSTENPKFAERQSKLENIKNKLKIVENAQLSQSDPNNFSTAEPNEEIISLTNEELIQKIELIRGKMANIKKNPFDQKFVIGTDTDFNYLHKILLILEAEAIRRTAGKTDDEKRAMFPQLASVTATEIKTSVKKTDFTDPANIKKATAPKQNKPEPEPTRRERTIIPRTEITPTNFDEEAWFDSSDIKPNLAQRAYERLREWKKKILNPR